MDYFLVARIKKVLRNAPMLKHGSGCRVQKPHRKNPTPAPTMAPGMPPVAVPIAPPPIWDAMLVTSFGMSRRSEKENQGSSTIP